MKIKFLIIFVLLFFSLSVKAQEISVDVGYPVVDKIEAQIFGVFYPQENIYKRLDRLETKIFGTPTNAPLSDRVDRLRNSVLGEDSPPPDEYIPQEQLFDQTFSQMPQSSEEYPFVLYELEKKLLGSVYINEPVEYRLSRLEMSVFGQASDSYPPDERLQRLCAYADAQTSDNYYDDQAQLRKYANGAQIFSILFMILQAFLL